MINDPFDTYEHQRRVTPSRAVVAVTEPVPQPVHDAVNHPRHYAPLPGVDFECIDVTRYLTFDAGDVVKYVWRFADKNGVEDVRKSRWYLFDALRHADPVFVYPQGSAQRELVIGRLLRLAVAHPNPDARRFFAAMAAGSLAAALDAVNTLLRHWG